MTWNVGGAHAVAMRDRGQPLHVRAEQPRERLGLGVAQLRKLLGNMRHRAVVLTQLLTIDDRGLGRRCRVSVGRQQ